MARKPTSKSDPAAELRAIFGHHVRARRVKAKWTQSELSKRSGITQEDLSRIENGQLNVTIQTISRLAEVLDTSAAEMLVPRADDPKA